MCVSVWPLLLLVCVKQIYSARRFVERDIDIGLYGRTVYILTDVCIKRVTTLKHHINYIILLLLFQTLAEIPSSICVWLAYLIPSYSMTGLYMQGYSNYNGFYLYLGMYVMC